MSCHTWTFPLPRPHTGPLLGNARLGAMVWGSGDTLRITLGRADWWDHRNGKPWTDAMSYANIRRLLEADDAAGVRALFDRGTAASGLPRHPSVLPVGRVELAFPGLELATATLDMGVAEITLAARDASGTIRVLGTLDLSPDAPVVRFRPAAGAPTPRITGVPAWQAVGEHLASISFEPPFIHSDGWTQTTPADAALTVRHRVRDDGEFRVVAVLGDESAETALEASFENRADWWRAYWQRVPRINVPNPRWSFLHDYGLYKFAGLTAPQGVAATLQGPWIEDYQMPPWSSDYHFNINVQMCYWPAYQAGLGDHLKPLFDLIESWLPILRENARKFVGVDDGYLLPHAVDDRCHVIGAFWTGTIDHACTAWVGKMMYDHYDYTGDEAFLRRLAFPFLKGAMRVYEGMLERGADGTLSLPVSVSPEYRGAQMNAWGRDASFQLAACHWLADALEKSARILGEPASPAWADIRQNLPLACLHGESGREEIALWQGLVLEESHRHHSHLGGYHPFDTLPMDDERWSGIAARTVTRWIREGMGLWSGWSMPWAAMLHSRFGNADMTELTLEIWERIFTNEGHGTLHDAGMAGLSLMGTSAMRATPMKKEIMQMDAGMAATAAIMDSLVHVHRGTARLFPGASSRWKDCSFENIRIPGGFRIGARRAGGVVRDVTIEATRAGRLLLQNPWPASGEPLLSLDLKAGETRRLQAP